MSFSDINVPASNPSPGRPNLPEWTPAGYMPVSVLSPLPPSTPVLVGLSGGADSRLALELAGLECPSKLFAVHLHHGIRGQEADRDAAFCVNLCREHGIPLFLCHADVPALAAASGRGIEWEAREVRYRIFSDIMTGNVGGNPSLYDVTFCPGRGQPSAVPAFPIPLLITAHHADDLMETVLMRLLRGTGAHGLRGIPPCRPFAGGYIIRPLLNCTKQSVTEACEKANLSYVTDSTNFCTDTERNFIRNRVIPLLENAVGRGVPQASILRMAKTVARDDDYLCREADRWAAGRMRADRLFLDGWETLDEALKPRVLVAYHRTRLCRLEPEGDLTLYSLSQKHLDALIALCDKAVPGSRIDLPGCLLAVISDKTLFIDSEQNLTAYGEPERFPAVPLSHGVNFFGPGDNGPAFAVLVEPFVNPADSKAGAATVPDGYLPVATAVFGNGFNDGCLYARQRQTGDVIFSHGMHKKIKKLHNDGRLPQFLRQYMPLICYPDTQSILWAPLTAFKDGYPPPDNGKPGVMTRISVCIRSCYAQTFSPPTEEPGDIR